MLIAHDYSIANKSDGHCDYMGRGIAILQLGESVFEKSLFW